MIILTDKDMGRWFTTNGTDSGQLIRVDYYLGSKEIHVTLLYEGGTVVESLENFKKNYKEVPKCPPEGALCEVVKNYDATTYARYSDGKGNFFLDKELRHKAGILSHYGHIREIKEAKSC